MPWQAPHRSTYNEGTALLKSEITQLSVSDLGRGDHAKGKSRSALGVPDESQPGAGAGATSIPDMGRVAEAAVERRH
jgi:hypothetical protein